MAGLVRQHLLHLRLGGSQPRACLAEPLDALFEQLQRLVQVELLRFEPPHDVVEAVELLCEAQGLAGRGGACHRDSPARAATSPSVTRSGNRSPDEHGTTRVSPPPWSSRARAWPRSRIY